jgi:hypothetical protein
MSVQYTFKATVKLRVIHSKIDYNSVKPLNCYNLALHGEILFGRFYP